MDKQIEYIDANEALDLIKKSSLAKFYKPNRPSLITWIQKYQLGHKSLGRWYVNKKKLECFIGEFSNGFTKKKGNKK